MMNLKYWVFLFVKLTKIKSLFIAILIINFFIFFNLQQDGFYTELTTATQCGRVSEDEAVKIVQTDK